MFYDIVTLVFAILGMVYLLITAIKQVLLWREENINITVGLTDENDGIFEKISNIRAILDFCGLNKKCTVIVVNYGAPEWFCDKLKEYFSYADNVKFATPDSIKELHT